MRTMPLTALAILLFVISLIPPPVSAAEAELPDSIAAELPDSIVIATEGAYPPFNFMDNEGNLKGFEVDLARAMCQEIGVRCKIVAQGWTGILPGLLAEKYDAIIASLYITEARKEKIAFSEPYYKVPARFVVPKNSDITISQSGLTGATVGTQRGASFERMIRDTMPYVDLRIYGAMPAAYRDLVSGRLDAAIADVVNIQHGLLDTPVGDRFEMRGPRFTNPKWFGYGAGVGVRKEDKELAAAFSWAINALREDRTYKKIADKWFDVDVYPFDDNK